MRFKLYREHGALNSPNIFNAFEIGLKTLGHESVQADEDVAVIWSVLWNGRMAPNKAIYDQCRIKNKPIIIIEVGNLLRNQTWRICLNHINGLGEFGNDSELDFDRPKKLGVGLKPIRTERNSSILIATQHQKSLQWENMPSMTQWTLETIEKIRKYTDRRIIIRPHPRSPMPGIEIEFKNVDRQNPIKVDGSYDDFDIQYNYHCVVNHNSGPPILAAIEGIPIITGSSSLAFPVSSKIEDIENIQLPDREEWFTKITHCEWTVDEIAKGIPLKRLENKILSQL
jgi:hypothetical protein